MKFYINSYNGKVRVGDELYPDKTLAEAIENVDISGDDEVIIYEAVLKPIKRLKRGYVELPLVTKKLRKRGRNE